NPASTVALESPARIAPASARAPNNRFSAVTTIVLPAPVSPVTTLNPGSSSTVVSSMTPNELIDRYSSMRCSLFVLDWWFRYVDNYLFIGLGDYRNWCRTRWDHIWAWCRMVRFHDANALRISQGLMPAVLISSSALACINRSSVCFANRATPTFCG